MRTFFHFLNKFFMVPMFRLGFGFFFGSPFRGYIMVLKVIGRRTGKVRFSPVNYAIADGKVYCVSGFRGTSDWLKNLRAHPHLEAILPAGAIHGRAEEVSDPQVRLRLIRQVLKNAGFAGFFEGYNPVRISAEELAQRTADLPLVCITPDGIGSGASDAGGWAWIWTPVSLILVALVLWLLLR